MRRTAAQLGRVSSGTYAVGFMDFSLSRKLNSVRTQFRRDNEYELHPCLNSCLIPRMWYYKVDYPVVLFPSWPTTIRNRENSFRSHACSVGVRQSRQSKSQRVTTLTCAGSIFNSGKRCDSGRSSLRIVACKNSKTRSQTL